MKKIRNGSQGFTLIELLVVVVIIGILAAIALPQYRFAVAKTKYNALKTVTRDIADSANRFYLTHSRYPQNYSELDLDLLIALRRLSTDLSFHPSKLMIWSRY